MLGAAVLIALAVLFLPMLFSSTPPKSDADQTVSLAIPPAPDRELQTRTLDVAPTGSPATVNGPQTAGAPTGAAQQPAPAVSAPAASVTPGSGGRLASVDIASRKPADALPEDFATAPAAGKPAATPVKPAAKPATAPVASAPPSTPAAAPALPPGTAARGSYSINLSAYADRSKADALVQKVKALGYPVSTASTTQAGKSLTRVTAGPFESRAAAETARLKIVAAVPGAPANLSTRAETQTADAPAPARPARHPGTRRGHAQRAHRRATRGWFRCPGSRGQQRDRSHAPARQAARRGHSGLCGQHRLQRRRQVVARPRGAADAA